MNTATIVHLMRKDWYFLRWPITIYTGCGVLAALLLGAGTQGAFYAGSVLLITAVIGIGVHLVMGSVLLEHVRRTQPFVLSLAVTPAEYWWAKVGSNLLIFTASWLLLVGGAVYVILVRPGLPDGLVPFAVLVLGWLYVGYALVLATALITDTESWTIAMVVACNIALQGVLYGLANFTSLGKASGTETIVWDRTVLIAAGAEIALIVLALGASLWWQTRRRSFV